jgi:SAM-dependent methyltransferase
MFGELVCAMERDTRDQMKDILGDLYEGAVSYGENGQFMTPIPVCELMAQLTIGESLSAAAEESQASGNATENAESSRESVVEIAAPDTGKRRVLDPCCGSGRMLLAAAEINRHWEFVGQDIDVRCVRMCALNLAFRNLYGYVIHGNTLALEQKLVYRTGFDGIGFIREIPLAACPAPVQQQIATTSSAATTESSGPPLDDELPGPTSQLRLF